MSACDPCIDADHEGRPPKRIQRRRTKGWRMPEGAVSVTRGTRWGNPFRLDGTVDERQVQLWRWNLSRCLDMAGAMGALDAFSSAVRSLTADGGLGRIRALLRGKDLACWCPLDEPCHADVLLRVANEPTA